MNYIVLDLEATCWKNRHTNKPNEIIEIGAVKIDSSGRIVDEFSEFVRPKLHPFLSDFCKELTTITQEDIDNADFFHTVIEAFKTWINLKEPYILCSWGYYDKNQFVSDCELHDLDTEWVEPHISIKHQYAEIKGIRRPIGMAGALKLEMISLDGTHHRGIDDARNISKIFLRHFGKWNITNKSQLL